MPLMTPEQLAEKIDGWLDMQREKLRSQPIVRAVPPEEQLRRNTFPSQYVRTWTTDERVAELPAIGRRVAIQGLYQDNTAWVIQKAKSMLGDRVAVRAWAKGRDDVHWDLWLWLHD